MSHLLEESVWHSRDHGRPFRLFDGATASSNPNSPITGDGTDDSGWRLLLLPDEGHFVVQCMSGQNEGRIPSAAVRQSSGRCTGGGAAV
jgi:hypothetical protein